MTYREKFESCKTWQDKVLILNMFHHQKLATEKHWSLRLTASYFYRSLGYVSESIKLAELSNLKEFPTRTEAIAFIRTKS
jgi:hypothetical protein